MEIDTVFLHVLDRLLANHQTCRDRPGQLSKTLYPAGPLVLNRSMYDCSIAFACFSDSRLAITSMVKLDLKPPNRFMSARIRRVAYFCAGTFAASDYWYSLYTDAHYLDTLPYTRAILSCHHLVIPLFHSRSGRWRLRAYDFHVCAE